MYLVYNPDGIVLVRRYCITCLTPKGAKVYPASRRRSNKRVGLKGQLAPHCVP